MGTRIYINTQLHSPTNYAEKFQPGTQSQLGLKLLSSWPDERSEGVEPLHDSGPEALDTVDGVSEIDGDGQVAQELGSEESTEKKHWKEEGVDRETEQRDQTPNWEVDNPQERGPEKGTITKDDHGT